MKGSRPAVSMFGDESFIEVDGRFLSGSPTVTVRIFDTSFNTGRLITSWTSCICPKTCSHAADSRLNLD